MKAILVALAMFGLAVAVPMQNVQFSGHPFQCTEDPQIVPAGPMNISLHPIIAMNEGSHHQGLVAAGLSRLETDINIIIITLTATFKVTAPDIDVDITEGVADGYMDTRPFTCIPVGNYTGTGNAMIRVRNLRVEGSATLFINLIGNRVNVRLLNINVASWSDLCLNFGPGFTIGGSPVDWDDLCANLKTRFDAEFANTALKNQLVERIRVAANVIVGQYTLEELLDLINQPGPDPCLA
jgi:hypothetical protein